MYTPTQTNTPTCAGHFVVSSRLGVELCHQAGVTDGKMFERCKALSLEYVRPYLIIQKEAAKKPFGRAPKTKSKAAGPQSAHGDFANSKKYMSTLITLARFRINILFSDSSQHTARLVHDLYADESKKGNGLQAIQSSAAEWQGGHPDVKTHTRTVVAALQEIPRVGYGVVHSLVSAPRLTSVRDILNATDTTLPQLVKGIPPKKAAVVHAFARQSYLPPSK